ncbi:hypothetical protein D3C78_1417440 [compost metagenome]
MLHLLGEYLQPDNQISCGVQGTCRQHHQLRQAFPLCMPATQTAFMLLYHGGIKPSHQRRNPIGRRKDHRASNRITLVRHGRRTTAPRGRRFGHFRHFGLGQQRDIPRQLAQRTG